MPQVTPTSKNYNAYDLASQYLVALGLPNTISNQRALAAWFLSESGHSSAMKNGVHVIGNNPLNITTSSGNYRLVGSHKIAVFPSEAAGATALKNLLSSPNHNYPGIVKGFKVGNGGAAVDAIINSGWVTGGNGPSYWHTTNGTRTNLLLSVYDNLGGTGASAVGTATPPHLSTNGEIPNPTTPHPTIPTSLATIDLENLLGKSANEPFTAGDAAKINAYMDKAAPFLKDIPFWNDVFYNIAGQYVGGTVGEAGTGLNSTLGTDVGAFNQTVATDAANAAANAASPFAAIAKAFQDFFGSIPYYGAIIGGFGLTLFGLYLITKEATSAGSTSSQSIVSPVPVFIREHS